MAGSQHIPRIIHQTYRSRDLPEELRRSVEQMIAINPGWEHRFYDDDDIVGFIRQNYGDKIMSLYSSINPHYGAARADLFRYLLMYKVGGVYLDIKSLCDRPLDEMLAPDDEYILSNWRNGLGELHEQHGLHKELLELPRGEFQQWYIACRPGHPFLRAVIDRVSANIARYRPWRDGIGKAGVLRLTGPIAYTGAIEPIRHLHAHRLVNDESEIGLRYSGFPHFTHLRFFQGHYTTRLDSIIRLTGAAAIVEPVYRCFRGAKQAIALRYWYPWRDKRRAKRGS